jgi:tetratricopeptide (TPR) repeat protein
MFDALSSSIISSPGSNLERLTLAAMSAFNHALSASYPAEKRIIVFTDGEALAGSFQNAVEKAEQEGITVLAVCIGSEKGGHVPAGTMDSDGFVQDAHGADIISRAAPGPLQKAVEGGGGLFTGIDDMDNAAGELQALLFAQNTAGSRTKDTRQKKDIAFFFVILALLFFAAHKCAFLTLRLLPYTLLLLCMTSCTPVKAKLRLLEGNFFVSQAAFEKAEESYTKALALAGPEDAPFVINALAYVKLREAGQPGPYAQPDTKEILTLLENADRMISRAPVPEETADVRADAPDDYRYDERHRELAYRIHYNAGIAYYNAGNAQAAAREFRAALLVNPRRIAAKRNLEISLATLENTNGVEMSETKSIRPIQEGAARGNSVLFDFIRQKEIGRWKSWEWQGGKDNSLSDY